jgi:hypothetical protein
MCMFGTGFWDAGIDTRGVEMIFIYLDVFFFFWVELILTWSYDL